jgi:hypothetical protein
MDSLCPAQPTLEIPVAIESSASSTCRRILVNSSRCRVAGASRRKDGRLSRKNELAPFASTKTGPMRALRALGYIE